MIPRSPILRCHVQRRIKKTKLLLKLLCAMDSDFWRFSLLKTFTPAQAGGHVIQVYDGGIDKSQMGEVRVIISDSRIFCNSSCGLLALYTCHHLTQPAGLISLNRSTGSMSLQGHAAGVAVESGFNSQRSCTTLPIQLLYIYGWWVVCVEIPLGDQIQAVVLQQSANMAAWDRYPTGPYGGEIIVMHWTSSLVANLFLLHFGRGQPWQHELTCWSGFLFKPLSAAELRLLRNCGSIGPQEFKSVGIYRITFSVSKR